MITTEDTVMTVMDMTVTGMVVTDMVLIESNSWIIIKLNHKFLFLESETMGLFQERARVGIGAGGKIRIKDITTATDTMIATDMIATDTMTVKLN